MENYQVLQPGTYLNLETSETVFVTGCAICPTIKEWLVLVKNEGDTIAIPVNDFLLPIKKTTVKVPYPDQYKPLHIPLDALEKLVEDVDLPGLGDK